MNSAELRFRITRALDREPGVVKTERVSPVPGEPLVALVTVDDPYTKTTAQRLHRVTIEEID